jgi:hypothetical protein
VKLIICSTNSYLKLGLSSLRTRTSATLLNMGSLNVLRVEFFLGKDNTTSNWLDPFYPWIKSLYLVNILLMTMFCSNLHVFFYLILNVVFYLCKVHVISVQLLCNLSLLICNLLKHLILGEYFFLSQPEGVIVS